jgi:hypothetical protein
MFKSRSLGRRHFRPSPEEARAYFKFRPRVVGDDVRSRSQAAHRAQIRADIERLSASRERDRDCGTSQS